MALIKCPECGKEISDKADVCIHCGFGVKDFLRKTKEDELIKQKRMEEQQRNEQELKKKMDSVVLPQKKPIFNGALAAGIIFIFILIFNIYVNSQDDLRGDGSMPNFMIILCTIIALICLVGGKNSLEKSRKMFDDYSNNEQEYRKQLALEQLRIEAMSKAIQETKDNKNKPNTNSNIQIKCPTCGSTNVNRITTGAKVTNIAMFGLLGNKRKKQFHCNNCKYNW